MTRILYAIQAVRKSQDGGRSRVSVIDNDVNQIIWHDDNPTNITNEQILAEHAELQTAYDAKEYSRNREVAYPKIGDQLDMQYHDKINGTTTWQDAIAKVKTDNPKE